MDPDHSFTPKRSAEDRLQINAPDTEPGSPILVSTPPVVGFTTRVRLPRDYYLRVLGNDYSVDPSVIGRMVDLHADLDTVSARCEGALVASHQRSWARHQTITDPIHVATAARLRADYQRNGSAVDAHSVLVRDLADYDARFGIDFTIGPHSTLDSGHKVVL